MEIGTFKLDFQQLALALVTLGSFFLAHKARKRKKEAENDKNGPSDDMEP